MSLPHSRPPQKKIPSNLFGGGSISQALSWIQPDRNAPAHFKSSSAQLENKVTSPATPRSKTLSAALRATLGLNHLLEECSTQTRKLETQVLPSS
ncbi:hypothetical protein DID88_009251 [Monilinia fructigena]|uniref:Uncharacterized protein n=1 Tax=Monilinia fructigena TaxID=38457 RepID=A0A395IFH0_9HELO|nr:hypothetical protein DID88_009251 [Monilinia fructigena]